MRREGSVGERQMERQVERLEILTTRDTKYSSFA